MTPIFLNIPLILISSLGLILNGYIVAAVIFTRQVATANNILLLHLGVVDVLLGVLFLVYSGVGKTDGPACTLHGFLHTLLHPMVLWTICGLNCDRYYAIAAPLHYAHIVNVKKVLAGLGTGWLVSLVLCLPPLFPIAPYGYVPGWEMCLQDFSYYNGSLWYSTLYTALTLLLPATIVVCCNMKVLMIARYHRHRIASAIYEVTLSAQVTITHQRNPFFVPTVTSPTNSRFKGRSAIYTVLQLLGSLTILYLPYYTLIVWQSFEKAVPNRPNLDSRFYVIAKLLLVSSPTINAFLYGVKSKPLRKTFENYWRKKQTQSEVNQEIQARTPSTCGSRRPSLVSPFPKPPTLQSRLSEALLSFGTSASSPKRPKLAIELSWRPASATNLTSLLSDRCILKPTASCNTLRMPSTPTTDTRYDTEPRTRRSNNSWLFQRWFTRKGDGCRSPRITITRTASQDHERAKEQNGSDASETSEVLTLDKAEGERRTLLREHVFKDDGTMTD